MIRHSLVRITSSIVRLLSSEQPNNPTTFITRTCYRGLAIHDDDDDDDDDDGDAPAAAGDGPAAGGDGGSCLLSLLRQKQVTPALNAKCLAKAALCRIETLHARGRTIYTFVLQVSCCNHSKYTIFQNERSYLAMLQHASDLKNQPLISNHLDVDLHPSSHQGGKSSLPQTFPSDRSVVRFLYLPLAQLFTHSESFSSKPFQLQKWAGNAEWQIFNGVSESVFGWSASRGLKGKDSGLKHQRGCKATSSFVDFGYLMYQSVVSHAIFHFKSQQSYQVRRLERL